jgi:hypothetical protein
MVAINFHSLRETQFHRAVWSNENSLQFTVTTKQGSQSHEQSGPRIVKVFSTLFEILFYLTLKLKI